MSKNISVKKNLKINTQLLFSRTEKSVLQNIRTFNVDMLILNNVVIWEKPTEWFWEFVKTLEPSIQLPVKTEVAATNNRGTRAFINGENVPERGVNEFSPLMESSVPKHSVYKGDASLLTALQNTPGFSPGMNENPSARKRSFLLSCALGKIKRS